ncbi:MAG TPA: glutamine amidotransferase, partial [Arthrobacter sp.]|nr:glutamine amidotransferase [Arthrobacter sp.]
GNNVAVACTLGGILTVVASYLHGSLLPKNPAVADFLVRHAALRRHGTFNDVPLEIPFERQAREDAAARPR